MPEVIYIAAHGEMGNEEVRLAVWKCALHLPGRAIRFTILRRPNDQPPSIEMAMDYLEAHIKASDRVFIKSALPA